MNLQRGWFRSLVVVPVFFVAASGVGDAVDFSVRAVSVNGEVLVGQKNLAPGDKLKAGDKITTRDSGSAKLLYPDKTLLDIKPSSSFTIKELTANDGAASELEFGSVRALVKKKLEKKTRFIIQTKTSVLAVRGTEFGVSVTPVGDGTFRESLSVADGIVDLRPTAGGDVLQVTAGQRVDTRSPGPTTPGGRTPASQPATDKPKVTNIAPAEIKKEMDNFKVSDQTFDQVVDIGKNPTAVRPPALNQVGAIAAEFKPPPVFQPGEVEGAVEGFKPPRPPRPPEPSAIQQLNPDIANQAPIKLVVKFTP